MEPSPADTAALGNDVCKSTDVCTVRGRERRMGQHRVSLRSERDSLNFVRCCGCVRQH